jgi:hypothetical protein
MFRILSLLASFFNQCKIIELAGIWMFGQQGVSISAFNPVLIA